MAMPTNPRDIDELLSVRSEDERLEFKAARHRYDFEKLVNYCVALANEGGGRIILGVTDKHPRHVVGTEAFLAVERTVKGIHDRLHLKIVCDEVPHPNGRVLVFQVPSRPVGQPIHYKGRYLMRVGEGLVPMLPDQLKRIMAEDGLEWALQPASPPCNCERVAQLLDMQVYFDMLRLPHPSTYAAILERFESEKLVQREDKGWVITNLGAILFAKNLSDFELLWRKAPRVIVYDGTGKLRSKQDRHFTKGYVVGFQEIVDFTTALVPSREVIETAFRREVRMFPEISVRELVANALLHQDFSIRGAAVAIELYDDRLEISSPGTPSISADRFIDKRQTRNERLGNLMRRLGICEEKGIGIDKVVQSAEEFQLRAPDFRVGEYRTTAVLSAHTKFGLMDRSDRIRATYQHCCLRYVMNQKMTNQSLRERFNLPTHRSATVSQIISATLRARRIKVADSTQTSTQYRHYVPFWA